MDYIYDIFKFAYKDINSGVAGAALCTAKGVGLTILSTLLGLIGAYAVVLIAIIGGSVTVVPVVLLSLYWDGFWDDIGYSLKWMWIVGIVIGFGIGVLAFLPQWSFLILGITIAICSAVLAVVVFVGVFPFAVLMGVVYFIYSICYLSCKCIEGQGCNCREIMDTSIKETYTSSPKSNLPVIVNSPTLKPRNITADTIIFDSTIYDIETVKIKSHITLDRFTLPSFT